MGGGAAGKCGRCGHSRHTGACRCRAASRCVPLGEDGGFICGVRPPCPCPWRVCKCGLELSVAVELPARALMLPSADEVTLVSVGRWSASKPGGLLAVWPLANGMLGCRDLPPGQAPGPGERRGTEHDEAGCGYRLRLAAGL